MIRIALFVALILVLPSSARADVAALFGLMTVNGPGPAFAVAFGHAPSAVGFEIEYLGAWGGESADRSNAGGVFGNLILNPKEVGNLQFFAIGGFGLWGESFADGRRTGAFLAKDFGGGIKLRITNRLRLRLDYRLFLLGDSPEASPSTTRPQRISAGLHVVI